MPGEEPAAPPPGASGWLPADLCPEGYLPRRRRRTDYELHGKEVRTGRPPEPNPEPPPTLPAPQRDS